MKGNGDKVRLGVIGCGMVCDSYLETLQRFDHVAFAACADLLPERARQVAAQFGFGRACSVDELLRGDDTDLVLNLTIPATHAELNLAALDRGKHVYSEKPLGITLQEAQAVLRRAGEKGLRVGCAPDTFLAGGHQHCRHLIDEGAIGRLVAAFGTVAGHGPDAYHANPHFFYEKGAGPMLDQGVYIITALLPLSDGSRPCRRGRRSASPTARCSPSPASARRSRCRRPPTWCAPWSSRRAAWPT